MGQLFKCTIVNLRPVAGTTSESSFIMSLFRFEDVRKYYVLRDDHSSNLLSFVDYMASINRENRGLDYIIELQDSTMVGLITAELMRDTRGQIMWNIGYAVHPNYRRKGYAKDALQGLCSFLQNFNIPLAVLDISDNNEVSASLAIKCGFEKMRSQTGGFVGFFDPEHEEVGMRFRWIKNLHSISKRDQLNQEAMASYRMKNYQQAINLYEQSLKEPYSAGSPFSDGQIYANLGMAYSSVRRYRDAYNALMKAYNMGVQNASVLKELNWLRNNAGIF